MALQVKAQTFRMPNLEQNSNVAELEEEMENWLKNKINGGFTFVGSVGGDVYLILIVKKE